MTFAAAPFERTYVYGGAAPAFVRALGLLLELLGMWLALGARIQLGFFTAGRTAENPVLVTRGFYRYIRHPIYAGTFLVTFGWPLIYGAPVTAILTLIIGAIFAQRRMKSEEAAMRARFGEEYDAYMRDDGRVDPGYLVIESLRASSWQRIMRAVSLRPRGGSQTSRRIPRIRESIRRGLSSIDEL